MRPSEEQGVLFRAEPADEGLPLAAPALLPGCLEEMALPAVVGFGSVQSPPGGRPSFSVGRLRFAEVPLRVVAARLALFDCQPPSGGEGA